MFEVGDRIIRKSNELSGFVAAMRKTRAWMVEVQWDATAFKQWLPAEEFRPWDRCDSPPPPILTALGRTTPAYLVELRLKHPLKKNSANDRKLVEQQLADDLASLSNRKKTRSRNKAQELIQRFEGGSTPTNLRRSKRTPQQQANYECGKGRPWKTRLTKEEKERFALAKREQAQMKALYQLKSGDYTY